MYSFLFKLILHHIFIIFKINITVLTLYQIHTYSNILA
jgi:hypothetical protein